MLLENIDSESKDFKNNSDEIISSAEELSQKLNKSLNLFLGINQYNEVINFVTKNIEETSKKLEIFFDEFKNNEKNLNQMANSVRQLALNTIIKSFKGEEQQKTLSIIADSITLYSENIIDIISEFRKDFTNYNELSIALRTENKKFNTLYKKIGDNLNTINRDIAIYMDFYKKISEVAPRLNDSQKIIKNILIDILGIKNNLNEVLTQLDENSELNSLKFDEFNAIYQEIGNIISELSNISNVGNFFIGETTVADTISIKDNMENHDPYNVKTLKDAFLNKLLFSYLLEIERNERIPLILEKWEYINTTKMLILNIRTDLKFSDGSPLDSEDIKYSFDIYAKRSKDLSFSIIKGYDEYIKGDVSTISGITFANQYTLVIHLNKNNTEFIGNLASISFPIIKKDSYPRTYKKITSGPFYFEKKHLRKNNYFFFSNPFLETIQYNQNNEYDLAFNEGDTKFLSGYHYVFLSGRLSVEKRKAIITLLSNIFKCYKLTTDKVYELKIKDPDKSTDIDKIRILNKATNKKLEKKIREIFSSADIKITITHKETENYDIIINKYSRFGNDLNNMFIELEKKTDSVFKAKMKMLANTSAAKIEDLFYNEYYLFPFEKIYENLYISNNLCLNIENINFIPYIMKKSNVNIDVDTDRFHHFFNLFISFRKKIIIPLSNSQKQLKYLQKEYLNNLESLTGEYDFFQGTMENFSYLIKEFEKLEKLLDPIYNIKIPDINADNFVFNDLKLSLHNFEDNILQNEVFLGSFNNKLEKIYKNLNKINDLSYFSSMEAEKNSGIKDEILGIINQIKNITKENTKYNLSIQVLLKESLLAIANLKFYIGKALVNIEMVFSILNNINEINSEIIEDNKRIKIDFENTYESIGNMKNYSAISLSKINELLSIYKENEKYFHRVLSYNKIVYRQLELIDELNNFPTLSDFSSYKPKRQLSGLKKIRELNIHLSNLPLTWVPAEVTDNTTVKYMNFLYSGLFKISSELLILPHLIDSWELKDKGFVAEFKLRKNLYFTNGEPLTTKDVIYTFYKIFDRNNPSPNAFFFETLDGAADYQKGLSNFIDGLYYIDDRRFAMKFKNVYTPFYLNLGTTTAAILWSGNKYGNSEIPVGIGPFVVERYNEEEVILKKSEQYFLNSNNFDRINISITKEEKISENNFIKGKLDIFVPSANFISLLNSKKIEIKGNIHNIPQLDIRYLGINVDSRPELKLKEVRQAIAYAVDRKKILKETDENSQMIANSVLPPGIFGYSEKSYYYEYDPERSIELLKKSGLKDGIKQPLKLYYSENELERKKANLIKEFLKSIKIEIDLIELSWHDFINACKNGEVELFLLGWIADNGDPDNFYYPLFHSKSCGVSGNYFYYRNNEVDTLLDSAMRIINKEKRASVYDKVEKIVKEDVPLVFLTHSIQFTITNENLYGFIPHPLDFFNIENWWKI
jgi:peptide/nickel transport system substrate-binding protein/oligopeptide transport system substrate-binding protein